MSNTTDIHESWLVGSDAIPSNQLQYENMKNS